MFKWNFIILLILCWVGSMSGQVKYEREFRIKPEKVPEMATDFMQALEMEGKIKWYKEVGLEDFSYEAKIKSNRKKYSIEFDSIGQLEDVEILIRWNKLPPALQSSIQKYFDARYENVRIIKLQVQYQGSNTQLIEYLKSGQKNEGLSIFYELVCKLKMEQRDELAEFLFNSEGGLVRKYQILQRNTDNLEF